MSSINPHYTFYYSQPEFYKFSHDSVFLARSVHEFVRRKNLPIRAVLDLCAGCGIVGLDFLFHQLNESGKSPERCDFVEIQAAYRPHFEANRSTLGAQSQQIEFLELNYSQLLESDFASRYDLVLCNPPYYVAGHGRLSPSEERNRCRFYIDSDYKTLLDAVVHSLKPGGQAFVLWRDLSEHGIHSYDEALQLIGARAQVSRPWQVRGTDVLHLIKN